MPLGSKISGYEQKLNNEKNFKDKERKIVSKEWLYIDKRDDKKNVCSCQSINFNQCSKIDEELHVSNVFSKLKPYIPLSVEEASLTTNLRNWNNCNVRLAGILKLKGDNGGYYLEDINEPENYKIVLDFKNAERIPLLNECVQVFGEIKIDCGVDDFSSCGNPFVGVSFFRNMESGNFLQYMEAVEKMKAFVPLFIKTDCGSRESSDDENVVFDYDFV